MNQEKYQLKLSAHDKGIFLREYRKKFPEATSLPPVFSLGFPFDDMHHASSDYTPQLLREIKKALKKPLVIYRGYCTCAACSHREPDFLAAKIFSDVIFVISPLIEHLIVEHHHPVSLLFMEKIAE